LSWIWWAPFGAAVLHIGEEFFYPGGFADWDRLYRPSISASITPRFHVVVNALLLFLALSVAVAGMPGGAVDIGGMHLRSAVPPSLAALSWLVLAALLASNAAYHVVGTYRTKRISPGVRTAVLLYGPLACIGYWYFLSSGQVSPVAAVAAALVGGSYHLWSGMLHRWRGRPRR
jgi:hypothetical protein